GYAENFEKKCIGKNKSVYVNTSVSLMPDKKRLLLNTADVSKLKTAEKKIAQYVNIMDKNIISSSTDLDGNITEVSEAFCRLTGYTREEFIGKKHNLLKHSNAKESIYQQMWETITKDMTWNGEVKNIKKDGSCYWINTTVFPIFNDENIKMGYMAIRQDITDKKRIEELSITDELTELYNRRYFNEIFEKELRRVQRDNKSITLLMLDVDHFKLYNDTYGHQEGDSVLAKIGKVLGEFANRAGDYAFRLGGEEFGLIYLSDNIHKAEEYALNIANAIENLQIPHAKNSASSFVTASIGVVFKDSQENLTLNDMYKIADDCLYLAKENGRNRVQVHKHVSK
ncbi:MAG: diguanylate cyclase, partial [Sulfurimonas sp.]|nr:diguanylate cyclase [Sulfurimonas sp.]